MTFIVMTQNQREQSARAENPELKAHMDADDADLVKRLYDGTVFIQDMRLENTCYAHSRSGNIVVQRPVDCSRVPKKLLIPIRP